LQQQLRTNERLTALGEVAAYVAHNIRNPLASIRAVAQAALIEREDAVDAEALRDIIQCADKIESWVARLLGFARPLTLMPELCSINAIVEEMISLHEARAAERQITFRCLPEGNLPELAVDRAILEQALAAIISNSLEATPPSGTITLTTGTRPPDAPAEWVYIRVVDTGAGIPARLLPDVFKPFVTGRAEGTGLGLAQAKKIIDLHLGGIDIESVEGRGTTVTIQLPVPQE
jgi:two-component system sensor histidine kinase HydH